MCIICGPFISKNIAVKVALWIHCKILSKEKKINRKYPPFLKRKAIFSHKVQFILCWHLLTLIKTLSMFVQGLFFDQSGRNFSSLSHRATYRLGGTLMESRGKSQSWNSSLQAQGDRVWGRLWMPSCLYCSISSRCCIPSQYDQYTFGMAELGSPAWSYKSLLSVLATPRFWDIH